MGTADRGRERRYRQGQWSSAAAQRRRRQKSGLAPREKCRLIQLVTCIILFLAVFLGKGIFPKQMDTIRQDLLHLLQEDTDFRAVFSSLGQAVSDREPVTEALKTVWLEILGGTSPVSDGMEGDLWKTQAAILCGLTEGPKEPVLWYDSLGLLPELPEAQTAADTSNTPQTGQTPEPEPTPTSQPLVEHVPYDGIALPDNATMDRYNLSVIGVDETVTPVLGWVSSPYGWREHPVDGGEKFHNGIDLAVNDGTDVFAFAAGTVDYIGDSPIYGLYLQLDHGGGLKTFYAHCSELCVQQGQEVAAGEKVAESGETGNATGPHLHFEVKYNGTLLNPAYYIETD